MQDEYERLAKSYDKQLKDKLTRNMYVGWRSELKDTIKKYDTNRGTLLDLGCGTGITTVPWVGEFDKVIGIELSKQMLKEARKKSDKVKWINQDIVNLKIEENADVVTCHFDVLNHILRKRDLQKAFNNVYEILNKDGLFIFDMMSPESFVWLKNKGKTSTLSERSYSKEEIKEMVEKAGFKILKIKKQKTQEWDNKPRRNIFLVQRG